MADPLPIARLIVCGGLVVAGVAAACGCPFLASAVAASTVGKELFTAAGGLASNVLAGDAAAALDRDDFNPQTNHDLRHAVGCAVAHALRRAMPTRRRCLDPDRRRLAYLAAAAESRAWMAASSSARTAALDDERVLDLFTAGATGKPTRRGNAVFPDAAGWLAVFEELRTLGKRHVLPDRACLDKAADDLQANFTLYLRNVVKGGPDGSAGGRAFIGLQLDFMRVAFAGLRSVHDKVIKLSDDADELKKELRLLRRQWLDEAQRLGRSIAASDRSGRQQADDILKAMRKQDRRLARLSTVTRRIDDTTQALRQQIEAVDERFGRMEARYDRDAETEAGELRTRPARLDEIDHLRAFAVAHMGPAIAPAEKLKSWISVNPDVFTLLEKPLPDTPGGKALVGYYSVRPITAAAVELLESCDLDGAAMLPEHIAKPLQDPAAIYIGGVAAIPGMPQAILRIWLEAAVVHYHRTRGVQTVYAKPVTAAGERLLKSKGFERVCADAKASREVYRLRLGG